MKVKVYNHHTLDFTDKFKDRIVTVPANSHIEMDIDEARMFVGQFYPIKRDANGLQDPVSYKMLTHDQPPEIGAKVVGGLICHACGYVAVSKKDYRDHVTNRLGDGKHQLVEEDETSASAEVTAMKDKMEKLEGLIAQLTTKRPRGRPKKEGEDKHGGVSRG